MSNFFRMAAAYDHDHTLLENIAQSTLESSSGCSEITARDRNTECSVCKQDWNTLSSDPNQLKWQSTRLCKEACHYLCTECYYRVAFDEVGQLKQEYSCPTCRAKETPSTDNARAHFNKWRLLKLLNGDKERNIAIQHAVIQFKTVKELKIENQSLQAQVEELHKRLQTIESVDSIEEIIEKNKVLEEKVSALNYINEKATSSSESAHYAMMHSIQELCSLKKKHADRIAIMQKEIMILHDTIDKNQQKAEEMRDQTSSFQDQLTLHALNIRVEQELNNASFYAMKADIIDKIDQMNTKDDFIPERLQQDIEKILNHKFCKTLKKLGDRTYVDAITNISSIDVTKYLLNKPCIRSSLLEEIGSHIQKDCNECKEDCGVIIKKLEDIVNGLDTLNGLHELTKEQINRKEHSIVTLTLPPQAVGLLPDGTDNNLITFLHERLPSKYAHMINFSTKLGVKLRVENNGGVIMRDQDAPSPPPLVKIGNKRKRTTENDTEKISPETKKYRSSTTQTDTSEITELDTIINVCNQSIVNISAKKEEFERKVQVALKLWDDQKNNRNIPWNYGLFYCYNWNKELFAKKNVSEMHCYSITKGKKGPCKLEHKCMYVMPSGNLCLSLDHTFMQHALFYDMPFCEAQNLHCCGILTEEQRDMVENICLSRDARLGLTKYGRTCNWISRFGLLDQCEVPVVENTDIIDDSFFSV